MLQPNDQDSAASTRPAAAPRLAARNVFGAARARFEGSVAGNLVTQLQDPDFSGQIMLLGGSLLVSLMPLLILLSAFSNARVDHDLALRLGLDRQASGIVTRLFSPAPASLTIATATSFVFVTAGTVAIASSLQQIYEKVFRQDHLGMRGLPRWLIWVVALSAVMALLSVAGAAVRSASAGAVLDELVTIAILTPFGWWTMHFLLAGRTSWRTLLPSAIATGVCFAGLGVFSKFYFSATIISDSKTYGAVGAFFGILTWFVAIGAVIIVGAVLGAVWEERRRGFASAGEDVK